MLILDEPANGLDPAGQQALRQVLRSTRDAGATLVISSHQLAEVQALCDHVGIIDHGRKVAEGGPAALAAELSGKSLNQWAEEVLDRAAG